MKKTYVPSDLLSLCTLPSIHLPSGNPFTFRQLVYMLKTKPGEIFS